MKHPDADDFIIIPRLEEYYRPKSPLVGWGEARLRAWLRAVKHAAPFVATGLFFAAVVLIRPVGL